MACMAAVQPQERNTPCRVPNDIRYTHRSGMSDLNRSVGVGGECGTEEPWDEPTSKSQIKSGCVGFNIYNDDTEIQTAVFRMLLL
jgi:hypothetical protein